MDQQTLLLIGLGGVALIVAANTVRRISRRKRVAEKLAGGATVVDVRTPSEFGGGHYPGAINVPLDKLSRRMKKIGGKDASVVVYCASGSRSRVAVSQLRSAGFNDVINAGGLANMPR